MGTGDWGIAIFGKKSNFYTIPDDLKIIYGDNYLLYQNHQNYKQNYSLSNIPFNHIHSSSSASPEFSHIISQDIFNSKKYFTKPGDDGISNKQYDYEIDYRGNVCIISLIYKKEKSYIFLRYRDDNGVYLDESLKKHILLLAPSIHKKLIPKLISDIKSGQNKSC